MSVKVVRKTICLRWNRMSYWLHRYWRCCHHRSQRYRHEWGQQSHCTRYHRGPCRCHDHPLRHQSSSHHQPCQSLQNASVENNLRSWIVLTGTRPGVRDSGVRVGFVDDVTAASITGSTGVCVTTCSVGIVGTLSDGVTTDGITTLGCVTVTSNV